MADEVRARYAYQYPRHLQSGRSAERAEFGVRERTGALELVQAAMLTATIGTRAITVLRHLEAAGPLLWPTFVQQQALARKFSK
jgi:hypothetical protein